MLLRDVLKDICDKMGIDRDALDDRLVGTLLDAMCESGGGVDPATLPDDLYSTKLKAICASYGVTEYNDNLYSTLLNIIVESMAGGGDLLPQGYKQAGYIRSTGTQYIDTGYKPVKETVIEIGYEYTSISESTLYYVFGNYNATGKNSTRLVKTTNRIYINMFTSTDNNNFMLDTKSAANVRYDEVLANDRYITNGTEYKITDRTAGTSNTRNLALFANYVSSSARKSKLKLYYCKIREGNTMVRDFTPCLDADGTPCLYDTVTQKPYYNNGTGNFEYSV